MGSNHHWESVGHGIYCVDANYIRAQFACCYLLVEKGEVAIIETGTANTVPSIMALLESLGLGVDAVRYIIPTHVHLDHAGGVGVLMDCCPQASLVVHPRGARHMINPEKLVAGSVAVYGQARFDELYGEIKPVDEQRVIVPDDGQCFTLAGRRLEIRYTPGHAEHHFCVWDETSRGWFTGDTFGLSYPALIFDSGRYLLPATTPVQFDPQKLIASVKLLMSYEPAIMYLTHFGALEQPEKYVADLEALIHAFCGIAEKAQQPAAIEEGLQQLVEGQILALAPDADAEQLRALLSLDYDLDAQGLSCWLESRGR